MPFFLKQNDTSPSLRAKLVGPTGAVTNLAGCSVRFHMKLGSGSALKVDGIASIVDAPNGLVQYNWSPSDTNSVGQFIGEFEVTFPGGAVETFPNNSNIQITISPEIN